jgi:putative ABC transport system permease protein
VKIFNLLLRNAFRHKLRTFLTMLGISIAVLAFVLLRTVVGAWNIGVDVASTKRLIVRHAVSFVFPLPYSYMERIRRINGVHEVSFANWFQGIYKDPADFKNFFPRLAVDSDTFFKVSPEFVVPSDQMEAYRMERNAAIIGAKTAAAQNLKIGDLIPVEGDIYPGKWEFVVRGIYHGRDKTTDETIMFFHWKYLDEALKRTVPARAGHVGWYVVELDNPNMAATVSTAIDNLFRNSAAETKTETEKAFNKSFISMYSALFTAMNVISFVIIGIILLVLGNTMAMTARERTTEYAVMKTLGFNWKHLAFTIAGESLVIALAGGLLGVAACYPLTLGFQQAFPTMFPVLPSFAKVGTLGVCAAAGVGLLAALFPLVRAARMTIVEGFRHIG